MLMKFQLRLNKGLENLVEKLFQSCSADIYTEEIKRIAFIGKPNVGKSTLLIAF